ncbi:MAG: Cd(II)/Pb(II)-responsive transcriptional regulator [Candidatus Adiutrix sp.]|jgi:Cd(II)/Pb(II)-responsive transcriptional regulator|nr:Cd(II)/Pb(II)-responsive transcriptional regulator [Candidatus Adiutrix sp.]
MLLMLLLCLVRLGWRLLDGRFIYANIYSRYRVKRFFWSKKVKIGELAEKTGCKIVTIRYYEKEGLLPAPKRSAGNYRLYGKEDLYRLEFIMHCRRLSMNLAEIKKLLAYRGHPQGDCTWVSELIKTHIKEINGKIASLTHLKMHLEQLQHSCAGGENGEPCGIISNLDASKSSCGQCAKVIRITSGLLK